MSQNKIAHKVQNLQSSAIRELLKHSKMEGVISLGGGIPNPDLSIAKGWSWLWRRCFPAPGKRRFSTV